MLGMKEMSVKDFLSIFPSLPITISILHIKKNANHPQKIPVVLLCLTDRVYIFQEQIYTIWWSFPSTRWNVQGARDRITASKMSTTLAAARKCKEECSYLDRPYCWLCHSFAIVVLKSWSLEGYCHHCMTNYTWLKKKNPTNCHARHSYSFISYSCLLDKAIIEVKLCGVILASCKILHLIPAPRMLVCGWCQI